jgi:hypothetical protein
MAQSASDKMGAPAPGAALWAALDMASTFERLGLMRDVIRGRKGPRASR